VENQNDGQGNDVILGVLKIDTITDPNASYTGCPSGSQLRPKINLVKGARIDPRRIKGIVTLTCTQPTPTPPTVVACPSGPSPYSYCLETPNDGFGNAVTIGVVRVTDAGDPYGLYGECNTTLTAYGIQPGFLSKSSLVTAVGRSLDNVRTIDLIACSATAYGVPDHLEIVPCGDPGLGTLGSRYDYCIFGTDAKGNGVNAGVK
jgi:hypothetical protein